MNGLNESCFAVAALKGSKYARKLSIQFTIICNIPRRIAIIVTPRFKMYWQYIVVRPDHLQLLVGGLGESKRTAFCEQVFIVDSMYHVLNSIPFPQGNYSI